MLLILQTGTLKFIVVNSQGQSVYVADYNPYYLTAIAEKKKCAFIDCTYKQTTLKSLDDVNY